ncbi:hypothetical protein [Streptomyces sp. URMC 129]|uniref:hypothetical protein n=1 Tax=Streptomyces sp. URMC 129 TaxID=3423407 RepID=UPI003F1D8BD6
MSGSAPDEPPAAVAVELERLRAAIEVGFTRTDGALALLMQRHDQAEEYRREHAARLDGHDARLDALERGETDRQRSIAARLAELERRQWPLPSLAALVALAGLALTLWQLATR